MEERPDFSNYLAHFSSDRAPLGKDNSEEVITATTGKNARDKLISILEAGKIFASKLSWTGREAVCFTECPWSSLLAHSKQYSPYAVGFDKPLVFASGGGPAYYVRADHWSKQQWDDHVKTFVTPFWPDYRPKKLKVDGKLSGKTVDYSHEREWRIPHQFVFELDQVRFVIVKNYEDVAQFPKHLKDAIGRERFLQMDVYKQIEKLWPVHKMTI